MSPETIEGKIFAEVQGLALDLNLRGILIAFCSKNNLEEIEEVFLSHPDMEIKDNNISSKRINWQDKASNLREITDELNVGLDSLVFVDDSPFEVNLIREQLPEVEVIEVPKKLSQSPQVLREKMNLF